MKLRLRYPATPKNAHDHAELAVKVAADQFDTQLDYSPESLETLDVQIESLRDQGLDGEAAAEVLFVFGCYVGEVMVRNLQGTWASTPALAAQGRLALADGGDPARRLGLGRDRKGLSAAWRLGDSEFLPSFFGWASHWAEWIGPVSDKDGGGPALLPRRR